MLEFYITLSKLLSISSSSMYSFVPTSAVTIFLLNEVALCVCMVVRACTYYELAHHPLRVGKGHQLIRGIRVSHSTRNVLRMSMYACAYYDRSAVYAQRTSIIYLPCTYVLIVYICLLYTSPSPRDATLSRMPSSA